MKHISPKRNIRMAILAWIAGTVMASTAFSSDFDEGYFTKDQTRPILEKTLRIHLSPSLESLSDEERAAVKNLIEVGQIMQRLYENSRHPEAITAYNELVRLSRESSDPERAGMLLDL